MPRKQTKPYTRPPFKGDFPAPENLEGLTPYRKRMLPWRYMPAHSSKDAAVFISGDGTYHALMHVTYGRPWAKVYRLKTDRQGTFIFHGDRQALKDLDKPFITDRILMLFRTFEFHELSLIHHAYHGEHSDFCAHLCPLPILPVDQAAADARQDAMWSAHAKRWLR